MAKIILSRCLKLQLQGATRFPSLTFLVITPPVSPNPQKKPLLPGPDTLELYFNEDFDFPALELGGVEEIPTDQNDSTIMEQGPTSPNENKEVSFDEILQEAQRNDPSMKTILKDLLPIKNNKKGQKKITKQNF